MNSTKVISVFEHEILRLGEGENDLSSEQLLSLQTFYGTKGTNYFSLIHKGIKFCEYVGVLRIGSLTIEILPKVDKGSGAQQSKWQDFLIKMLKNSGFFPADAPSSANLKIQKDNILHLYIDLFIKELDKIVHLGLLKNYRQHNANMNSLKGKLIFSRQIQKNIVHSERFFSRHSIYDNDHLLNQILLETLILIEDIAGNEHGAKAKRLGLNFEGIKRLKVNDQTFKRLFATRKNQKYEIALNIAKLLLLNFHPDVSKGKNYVLALMFDMNRLWETYVFKHLLKQSAHHHSVSIKRQQNRLFAEGRHIRPDMVIENNSSFIVLDTKWKAPAKGEPSVEDLRQMYTYNHHFKSNRSILLYPNTYQLKDYTVKYVLDNNHIDGEIKTHYCSVVFLDVWQLINETSSEIGLLDKILSL